MERLNKAFNETKRYLENYFDIDLSDLTYNFNVNSVRVLGCFTKSDMNISLNKWLYKEKSNEYIEYVMKHEIAHAIVYKLYYNPYLRSHGKEFKNVCKVLGIPGTATTDKFNDSEYLKIKRRNKTRRKQFVYTCNCGKEHILSSIRHNRVLKGTNYICSNCKSRIRFVKEIESIIG